MELRDSETVPISVLVTGASAGLGVDFARQLSKRGHRLVLAARRKERLESLANELGNARAVAIDLSKANAAAKLLADLEAAGEQAEVLINNAGFGLIGRFAELGFHGARQRGQGLGDHPAGDHGQPGHPPGREVVSGRRRLD